MKITRVQEATVHFLIKALHIHHLKIDARKIKHQSNCNSILIRRNTSKN